MKGLILFSLGSARYVMAIECYLDDSYDIHKIPITTMAGYVSTEEAWKLFELEARKHLDCFSVSVFHSKPFHSSDCEFAGWSGDKKICFLEGLFDILSRNALYGISVSALSKVHKQRKAETGLSKTQSPYGFCFNVILDTLLRDEAIKEAIETKGATLSLKVEEGNPNNAGIRSTYMKIKGQYSLQKQLSGIGFVPKKSCVAVQAADAIAFYSRRHAQAVEENGREPVPYDRFLKIILERLPHATTLAYDFHGALPIIEPTRLA